RRPLGPRSSSSSWTASPRPAAGATTSPSPPGRARAGLRKKASTKSASAPSETASQAGPRPAASAAASPTPAANGQPSGAIQAVGRSRKIGPRSASAMLVLVLGAGDQALLAQPGAQPAQPRADLLQRVAGGPAPERHE